MSTIPSRSETAATEGARDQRMRVARPGDTISPRALEPLTRTDIIRFAGAGGDFNPLHHDTAVAQAAGFDDVIAMGQLQAGILAGFVSDWAGIENLMFFEARFVRPVKLGDALELFGEVDSVTVSALDGAIAIASLTLRAEVAESVVVSGQARVMVQQTA